MLRRFKRMREFDISLQIKQDQFLQPPRSSQQNWLLNQALGEFAHNLFALDKLAKRFVPGLIGLNVDKRSSREMQDDEIMEDWQIPLMDAMADIVTESHGDVLEIGFGKGVSAEMIQHRGVKSHTIVECNDSIIDRYDEWKAQYPDRDIRLIRGMWQDVTDQLGDYDGVFFHTYPVTEKEQAESLAARTFAEPFFPVAADHLRSGGIFTYLTNEIDSFSRTHQRLVLEYFRSMCLQVVPLEMPDDVRDAWWADSMMVIKAVK